MKILEKEIALREETRSLEQVRPALNSEEYGEKAKPLAGTQLELAGRVKGVARKLHEQPKGDVAFAREIALMARVEQVMREAHGLLARPETGPETIAAETEVIELLLQARRSNPKGGGGGGGATPGGGGSGTTEESALALIGDGSERNATAEVRAPTQATGVSGAQLPAEYRAGLDAYFGTLEKREQGR